VRHTESTQDFFCNQARIDLLQIFAGEHTTCVFNRLAPRLILAATWSVHSKLWVRAELTDFREHDQVATGRKADTRRFCLTMMLRY
jgi:hypothetical protein